MARLIPSSAIEAANSAVREILPMALSMKTCSPTPCDKVTLKTVCGTYQTFTDKQKAEFAKRAAENGITTTILPRVKNFATC